MSDSSKPSWAELAAEWTDLPWYDDAAPNKVRKQFREAYLDLMGRATSFARRHPRAFWGWFLSLEPAERTIGGLVGSVLRRWSKSPPVPRRALRALVTAGVAERNPSFNRTFIEPATRAYGWKVVELLMKTLETGTPDEKAGAANALYWANIFAHSFPEIAGVRDRERHALLHEFVTNDDLDVRRSILGKLSLDPAHHPPEMRPLIARAIEIARGSSDEYLRHRIEIQLGAGGPFKALPQRISGETHRDGAQPRTAL